MMPILIRITPWLAAACVLFAAPYGSVTAAEPTVRDRLADLERASGGRLGVAALSAANQVLVSYRANERFPFCSTFKAMLAGAILHRSATDQGLLAERIRYTNTQLVTHSPITEKHVGDGMTVAELCAATIQTSDNTAANLLIARLGGPDAVTDFARSVGDTQFRLDRWETALNTAIPGDVRDTTTPGAMAHSLRRLALGEALTPPARTQLNDWLRGSTTGATRIRAGVPADWQVGDKTGTGGYGTTNDIAVLWPPGKPPVVLTVYFTQPNRHAAARNDVIAEAARFMAEAID
jgi:beta-lactamase class A